MEITFVFDRSSSQKTQNGFFTELKNSISSCLGAATIDSERVTRWIRCRMQSGDLLPKDRILFRLMPDQMPNYPNAFVFQAAIQLILRLPMLSVMTKRSCTFLGCQSSWSRALCVDVLLSNLARGASSSSGITLKVLGQVLTVCSSNGPKSML